MAVDFCREPTIYLIAACIDNSSHYTLMPYDTAHAHYKLKIFKFTLLKWNKLLAQTSWLELFVGAETCSVVNKAVNDKYFVKW